MTTINETSPIKLVAVDVDGTLITPDLQIPARTQEAIRRAQRRGVRFVIVTGRMYQSALPYAQQLGLEGAPLVAYNGGMVREYPSGRLLHHQPVPLPIGQRLAQYCEAEGLHVQAYVDDELYVPELDPQTELYVSVSRVNAHPVGPLSQWLHRPSTKLLIVAEPERIKALQPVVQELLGAVVTVVPSYPTFLEIFDSGVSKGAALEVIASSYGLSATDVMAVGDAMNDLSMIRWAGTSFAIAHAPQALKEAATHVTESGAGEGVAEALAYMGLC